MWRIKPCILESYISGRFAATSPQQLDWTSCSNQLADLAIPCGYPVRYKKALLEEQISAQRCCKSRAVIVRCAGIPCTLMTLTLSVCHAWGNRPSSSLNMISVPRSFGASDGEIDDSLFFWWLRTRRSYRSLWLTPPSYRRPRHVTPDSEQMSDKGCQWARARMVSAEEPSRRRLDECFLTGSYQANASSPKFIRAHDIVARPPLVSHPSFCFSCSHICWWRWRKRIWAPASSGWACGRTSLPAHSYQMEGEGEPSVQAV